MADFTRLLKQCMEKGDLTVADLHHWFSRPRATVRTWVIRGHTPRGPAGELAWQRLHHLMYVTGVGAETMRIPVFPPSRALSAIERPRYITQVRDGIERAGISARGAA